MPLSTEEETEAQSRKVRCDHKSQGRNYLQVFCPQVQGPSQGAPFSSSREPPFWKVHAAPEGIENHRSCNSSASKT